MSEVSNAVETQNGNSKEILAIPSKFDTIQKDASYQNISTDVLVDSNVFDVTKHYIHSLADINGKYEQFFVYGDGAKTRTVSLVHFGENLCGHLGIVHGGCISTVCDELFGWTMVTGHVGFTAYLNVNFRKPLPTQTSALIFTELDRREGRKVFMKSRVEDDEGNLFTEATAFEKAFGEDGVINVEKHFIHSLRNIGGKYETFVVYGHNDKQSTTSFVYFGNSLCGHEGIVHGGCISTVCDELFGWTMIMDKAGFTANLNVNFRKPLKASTLAVITTELEKIEGRKVYLKSKVQDTEGNTYTEATSLFILPRPSQ
ncbi:hypothetical protein THRCLA_03328 [Thraustotheca clavata]|uniref:Acyl-coenzyme A thioesterase THEM4 n=1 Tax=Thraustotheca clavata TaxID=74557 RepID=A0A1W0A2K0_9STRA|nr:hypothetical protein THRCLA_03328 [Thraustotheca clavata]